ncbi:MAG: hypothetical protein JWP11_772 [Frankiales bacterium]|nr:hypothetical protein [Frankiales bacterium]
MADTTPSGWRPRMRASRLGSWLLKGIVLLVGAFFIAIGLVLVVLPGPLTMPPVLLGLYIWSTEFAWAERLRLRVAVQGRLAWEAARRRPVHAAVATLSGVLLVVAGVLAVRRYDIVDRLLGALG